MTEAFIKLDFACNLKCLFCCTADDTQRISLSQAKALIDRYMQMGYSQISFTGGEPAMAEYLPEAISYAKSKGAFVKLQTNAVAIAKKSYAEKIIKAGIDLALVSIHSHESAINDRITQVKGSLESSLKGIAHLIEAGISVHIAYVVTTLNKDLTSFLRYMHSAYPTITTFQFFVPWARARGWENRRFVPRFRDIEKELIDAFSFCTENGIRFTTRGIPLCYMQGFEEHSSETRGITSDKQAMIINDFTDDRPRHSFEDSNAKEPQCAACSKNAICGGVWDTYPTLFPGDLRPIPDAKAKRDRRLELLMGYTCNNNCLFCYITDEKTKFKDKTTAELRQDITESRLRGSKEIAFLGGEPTIRKDLFSLIRFAKEEGFTQIKVTTNGRMLSIPDYATRLADAGVTKILFSIHGHDAKVHDAHTLVPGSFEQLMNGVRNVSKKGSIIIETNSTITKKNYMHLPKMAELFISLGMLSSEFIFCFPHGNALIDPKSIVPRYTEARKSMEEALDIGRSSKTKILMRYVPYCILPDRIWGIADQYDPAEREQVGPGVETLDVIKARRDLDRRQVAACKGCKHEKTCEGPWKVYPTIYGEEEFITQ